MLVDGVFNATRTTGNVLMPDGGSTLIDYGQVMR